MMKKKESIIDLFAARLEKGVRKAQAGEGERERVRERAEGEDIGIETDIERALEKEIPNEYEKLEETGAEFEKVKSDLIEGLKGMVEKAGLAVEELLDVLADILEDKEARKELETAIVEKLEEIEEEVEE